MANNLLDKSSIILTPTAYNNGEALCVKPSDGSGDFQFSRNSAATRVNAQGLVENVQILSSNLVQNGDFSEEGAEEVSNGNFSQEGAEEVTNGNFDTDLSGWQVIDSATGIDITWTENGVSFITDGAGGGIQQSVMTIGKYYLIEFDYTAISGGIQLSPYFGSIDETKRYSGIFEATTTNISFYRNNSFGNTEGLIDNVSCVEVGQDWTLENTWSIGDSVANGNGANGSSEELTQSGVTTIGKTYKVTYEILNYVSGSITFLGSNLGYVSANGIYTDYYTSTTSTLKFRPNNFNGSITNISVKQVGQDWDILNDVTSFSFENGIANIQGTANSANNGIKQASISAVIGKTYKISATLRSNDGGLYRFRLLDGSYFDLGSGNSTEFETITSYHTATSTAFTIFATSWYTSGTSNFDISNISIIEISTDTNLPRISYENFSYQDALGSELITGGNFSNPSDWNLSGQNLSISNGKGISTGSNFGAQFKQTILTINKTYKLVFDIVDYTSGAIGLTANYYGVQQTFNSVGTHTANFTSLNQTELRLYSQNFIGSIDNVSVKEVTGQEVVPNSGCGSWLFEPQSTNLITQSELFSDAYWGKTSISVLSNVITSPSGEINASKIVENNTNSNFQLFNRANVTSGSVYTSSIFAKSSERYLQLKSSTGFASSYANFDLINGVLGTNGGSLTPSIEDFGNGWYRCSVTYTATSTTNALFVWHIVNSASASRGQSYQGDGTSGVYIWAAQIEQGNISSYIPTSGSQVTRNQDVCTNGGSLATINSTEGVLYAEIAALADGVGTRTMSLSDGTANNSITIRYTTSVGVIQAFVVSGGSFQFNANISGVSVLNFNKVAIKYSLNDMALWINGVEVATDTSGTMPLGLNEINFTRGDGANKFFSKTKALAVWKEALSDSELQSLTTI